MENEFSSMPSHAPVYYPIDENAAKAAHESMSFREYRSPAPAYREKVDSAYESARRTAEENPAYAEEAFGLANRFAEKYAEWLNRGYRIDAMCPSVLVAGPSGISSSRKDRQLRAYDSHMQKLGGIMGMLDKIEDMASRTSVIKSSDPDAQAKLEEKISDLTANHERMKQKNAEARKAGHKAPHPGWELANSRRNIANAKKRLEAIAHQRGIGSSKRTVSILGEQAQAVENTDEMRLQLIFESKPSDGVLNLLKRNAFKWSRKNGAWQRQLTGNALLALSMMEEASHDR